MAAPPAQSSITGNYWVLPETGTIQRQTNPLLRAALYESGWFGFATMAEAKQFAATNVASQAKQEVGQDVSGAVNTEQDVNDFFHRITEAQTWTRVAEVALGGILLYAGVRALSQGTSTNVAAKQAARPVRKATKTVSRVAVPETRLAGRVAAKRVAPKFTAHRARVRKYGAKTPYGKGP